MDGQAPQTLGLGQRLELRLRGFSPRELTALAERRCAAYFGADAFKLEDCTCVPCVCSLGGRVRLYEAHVVASAAPAATQG